MDTEKLDSWRAYLLEYVAGVLWLAGFALVSVSRADIGRFAKELNDIAAVAPNVRIPDGAAAFAFLVAGLVFPYALAVAIRPITSRAMSIANRLFWRPRWNDDRRNLNEIAGAVAQRAIQASARVPYDVRTIYLTLHNNELSKRIQGRIDDARFRWSAAIPIAILLGGAIYRMTPTLSVLFGVAVGVLALIVGVGHAHEEMQRAFHQIDAAVLMIARREGTLASDPSAEV